MPMLVGSALTKFAPFRVRGYVTCQNFYRFVVKVLRRRLLKIITKLRVKLFPAFRTNPMAELDVRMLPDIQFDLTPIAFIVAYFLTRGTNG